ncbi:hypothetical protein CHS0354_037831 [Potamilus streckersoni]|uniref:Uncharacterized protein n=1 Tax=Potamilus streckersoni TaxID=2493646 RepID=A0AAE0VXH0_9BIVA|nr:hypothetical protein CHS0354_037831 [Potamilus streckersoni]
MEESELKDLQCLITQRLQRPGFARMISWEFSKVSDEEQIKAKKILRRKRTEGLKDEESGSDLKGKDETVSLSQNSSIHTTTDSMDKLTLSVETNSSTDSEECEYYSAPEDVEIIEDDASTGTEETFETTRTSNDVFLSIGACNTGNTYPSERKRRPSKKQKRKRRQEMKCEYINDLFVISNIFDLENDISEANDDGVTLQNPIPSLVQLCLKAASQISEGEKSEIPLGIKRLMASKNQINSLQRLQLSWLQNNVLASFEPENTFTNSCLYQDRRKVITEITLKGIQTINHISVFLPTRNILNYISCYKHKAHDQDQIYRGSKVSSYLLHATNCRTGQMDLLYASDYQQLVDVSVQIVYCLSALASCIDLMLPHTFSDKLVGQKRIILGEEEATRIAKETMYIRVRNALEKRFPTVVEHLYDIALPYVMWARGNIQSATEMFINLAKAEKRSK